MFDWIARNWVAWMSKPEWWQADAAFLGVAFAALLYCVTRKYVKLTQQMLRAQTDPVVEVALVGEGTGFSTSHAISIKNQGSVPIIRLQATSRAYKRVSSGRAFPITKLNASPLSIQWPRLVPNDDTAFQFKETVEAIKEARILDVKAKEERVPNRVVSYDQALERSYEIIVTLSYQREGDLKQFKKTSRLLVDWLEDGTTFTTDAALYLD